jgi:hypothetical protein
MQQTDNQEKQKISQQKTEKQDTEHAEEITSQDQLWWNIVNTP